MIKQLIERLFGCKQEEKCLCEQYRVIGHIPNVELELYDETEMGYIKVEFDVFTYAEYPKAFDEMINFILTNERKTEIIVDKRGNRIGEKHVLNTKKFTIKDKLRLVDMIDRWHNEVIAEQQEYIRERKLSSRFS